MKKQEIFSKLKDYNNQLETVLENKDFSSDTKNLLLDMIYKLEVGYRDYNIVKRDTQHKAKMIENIVKYIQENCKDIELLNPRSTEKCIINRAENKISVFPNEKYILYGIVSLSKEELKYDDVITESIASFFNEGNNIDKTEVLRNFNGWSWEPDLLNIINIKTNLIYQNIELLVGAEYLDESISKNDMHELNAKLNELYGQDLTEILTEKLINYIISYSSNTSQKERMMIKYNETKEQISKMNNKEKFLQDVSDARRTSMKLINEIDKMLNNKELLRAEYEKRNAKLPLEKKIFSISHLSNLLINKRNEELLKIKQYNELQEPKKFVEKKEALKKLLKQYENVNLEEKAIEQNIIELQKVFLQCIKIQIKKVETKKDLIDLIYKLRYYNLIEFKQDTLIKDVPELQEELNKTCKILITKACNNEILNIFSQNVDYNYEIIKIILDTRTIILENIEVLIKQVEDKLAIHIYDSDLSEVQKEVELKSNREDLKMKLNKKYRIFI